MYIRENFIYLKNKENVSLRKISASMGISIKTLSYIMNKPSKNISVMSINKLAKYFYVSLDDLVNIKLEELDDTYEHGNLPCSRVTERVIFLLGVSPYNMVT